MLGQGYFLTFGNPGETGKKRLQQVREDDGLAQLKLPNCDEVDISVRLLQSHGNVRQPWTKGKQIGLPPSNVLKVVLPSADSAVQLMSSTLPKASTTSTRPTLTPSSPTSTASSKNQRKFHHRYRSTPALNNSGKLSPEKVKAQ